MKYEYYVEVRYDGKRSASKDRTIRSELRKGRYG